MTKCGLGIAAQDTREMISGAAPQCRKCWNVISTVQTAVSLTEESVPWGERGPEPVAKSMPGYDDGPEWEADSRSLR
jgi:hypothetical protein